MERYTMRPIAFITTLQPYLLGWVLAISFFLTMAFVAIISKNRTWKEIALWFAGSWVVITVIVMLCTSMVLNIHVMDLEVVWLQ